MTKTLSKIDVPAIGKTESGKVRESIDLDSGSRLIVTTDRISAFDVVMEEPVPGKGFVLNQLSMFWFWMTRNIVENHFLTADIKKFPEVCQQYADILAGRSMIVRKANPLPIECIVRGYITGSGWKDYKSQNGYVCGIKLPDGLVESEKLPQPIFTPSTKAEIGQHDENIAEEDAIKLVEQKIFDQVKALSLEIYKLGEEYARKRGIIIADTKMEFGLIDGKLILIDELLTPDSSRFWPIEFYQPGKTPPSFDKQYLRDYLTSTGWNKQPPPPSLPSEVIENTRLKYEEALRILKS